MATTTNLTTLKINYLSQAQYNEALTNGQINENELYFTPSDNSPSVTINLNGANVTSPSFYAPTTSGIDGQYLISSGEGEAPEWSTFPTIPTISLNGSNTDSPSFYAPTGAGSNGQVLTSSGSEAPSWTNVTSIDSTYSLSNSLSSHKFTETLTASGRSSGTSTVTMEFAAGYGITLTDDTSNKIITIAGSVSKSSVISNAFIDGYTSSGGIRIGINAINNGGTQYLFGARETAPVLYDDTNDTVLWTGYTTLNPPPDGTTSVKGIVQLTDSTSSTSTTTAATPNSVRIAYNLANAAMPKSGGTFTGQAIAAATTAYTTANIKNIILSTSAPGSTSASNGTVWIQYVS